MPNEAPTSDRLKALGDGRLDVLVIGGGIVGAGVARDAAARGLKTLLVEQADFASGTSSRSSRLLHGGLRYLAQGRIGLVREASTEKMLLSRLAPHLCSPLPFVFPAWRGSGWSRWKLSLGVRIYDLLCGGHNLGRSSTLGPEAVREQIPGLRATGLNGAVRYFDALTNDSRLVLDTLRSAVGAGASVMNYTTYVSGELIDGAWRCVVQDRLNGARADVQARTIVNATGAWAPGLPHSEVRLRLTKGIHLVVDRTRLPVSDAVVLPEGDRILFVIPWGERVILGTTDTDYSEDPGAVRTEAVDIEYVLRVVNGAFPEARITPGDVIATWAGVRPLVAPAKSRPGAPSDTSRGHAIRMAEPGWFDVVGGKLTTYRLMGEQTVDQVGRFLGMRLPRSLTAKVPLARPEHSGVLPPPVDPGAVRDCCQNEWAVHLDDVLVRRTSWLYYHPDRTALVTQVTGWMGDSLGWDATRRVAEIDRLRDVTEFPLATGASTGP